ncbi:MAG: lysophospholipid acyltransferase family protein [Alphaproteobacteria bacterium]|nr:lysophospholipid acyltransferase family protein [Alphaproteobacteria bacterium]
MRLTKRLLRNDSVQAALCWLIASALRLINLTLRWDRHHAQGFDQLIATREPFILAFWHGRLTLMPFVWPRGYAMDVLISEHRDGRMIARTITHFGIGNVAGSTSNGGALGLKGLVRLLKAGRCVAITPDGPRGPRMRAANGVGALALLAKAKVVPVAFGITRRRIARSWDSLVIPLPFGRACFVFGEPILPSGDAESLTRTIEAALVAVTHEADRRCNTPLIHPAEVA